ncbi:MAG: enoyl-CoA hydratase/isomerase family protein [Rhodovibrio sp.]|nr:enoyl-CoA hydratase/isomerase family protein [Rhodovibrio sp.]
MSEQTTGTAATPVGGTDEIAFYRRGGLGEIELTRPKALNALTIAMIEAADPQLRAWQRDEDVRAVLIRGQGRRLSAPAATCARSGTTARPCSAGRATGR